MVEGVVSEYTPSVGFDKSSGSYGLLYVADESEPVPSTSEDFLSQCISVGPNGCRWAVRNRKRFTIPKGSIKNISEGYGTSDTSQTPGKLVIGSTSAGEVASPGTIVLHITYRFFSPYIRVQSQGPPVQYSKPIIPYDRSDTSESGYGGETPLFSGIARCALQDTEWYESQWIVTGKRTGR